MLSFSSIPRAAAAPRRPSPAVGTRHGERGRSHPYREADRLKPEHRQRRATSREAPRARRQAGVHRHLRQYAPHDSISGQMPQHAASAVAAHCIAQRSALRCPSHRTAPTEASQCAIHPGALSPPRQPISEFKNQHSQPHPSLFLRKKYRHSRSFSVTL